MVLVQHNMCYTDTRTKTVPRREALPTTDKHGRARKQDVYSLRSVLFCEYQWSQGVLEHHSSPAIASAIILS